MRKELTPDDAVRKEMPAAKPNSFEARLDAFMLRHPRLSIDEATDALIASKPSQDALRSLRHMERTFGLSRPGDAKWPEIDRAAFRTKVAEWRAKKAMHEVPIDEEFKALIPSMRPEEFAKLEESIQREGCRDPLVVWKGSGLLLDGHNRYEICRRLEQPYAITELALDNRDAATAWILENQLSRRNLTDAAFTYYLGKTYEARKRDHGGDRRSGEVSRSHSDTLKRTREALAEEKKVSPQTVARAAEFARAMDVLTDGKPEARQELLGDESLSRQDVIKKAKAIEKAHTPEPQTALSQKTVTLFTHLGRAVEYPLPKAKPAFNPTNDFVGWAEWTWNPVTGCLHSCREYCYANEMANRPSYAASYPVKFEPFFHSERLGAPANTKVPADARDRPTRGRVFVCSMADLYGAWVPDDWITQVHAACTANPQWQYLMLTKFPERYVGRTDLPPTAWLGTSVDTQKRVRFAESAFSKIKGVKVKWLSLEPLLEPLKFNDLSMFDWIVIGSLTETRQPGGIVRPAFAPPFEWVARIVAQARDAGCKVFLKHNLMTGAADGQHPGMVLPQESPTAEARRMD